LNKTVELVRLWGVYEEQHPAGTLEEFFRHQLLAESKQKGGFPPEGTFPPDGPLIPDINGRLMILIRRIGKYHILYSNKALEGTGLLQIEEFGILVSIFNQGNPFKSEVIFQNMMELSSGTNMLMRMKRRGLISEYSDKEDKRMKRLRLTSKGEQALKKGKVKVLEVAVMMMHALSDEDKQLSIQLLHQVHAQFEGKFQKQRNLDFEEIYRENMR
jgi:DNA-binding MarR family transcriptional regulator